MRLLYVGSMSKSKSVLIRMDPGLKGLIQAAVASDPELDESKLCRRVLRDYFESQPAPKKKKKAGPKKKDTFMDDIFALWGEIMPPGITRPKTKTAKRKALIASRRSEEGDLLRWEWAMRALRLSPWHMGNNDRRWKADLEFLLQPSQFGTWIDAGVQIENAGAARDGGLFAEMMREERAER